eukprot:CAMPEP_0185251476 /NCGR_PEP_ID=MMETSP1359-20130426/868_1 /TAXON_ID=552665 /ORGANISM="Bigelowiella longifila, Strain CCMP242" /LENGTH=161 /DNA_ID=CAMNT_0027833387 /DNA_START=229 /DNA_END=714 /DNA_ORIENTATION=+
MLSDTSILSPGRAIVATVNATPSPMRSFSIGLPKQVAIAIFGLARAATVSATRSPTEFPHACTVIPISAELIPAMPPRVRTNDTASVAMMSSHATVTMIAQTSKIGYQRGGRGAAALLRQAKHATRIPAIVAPPPTMAKRGTGNTREISAVKPGPAPTISR